MEILNKGLYDNCKRFIVVACDLLSNLQTKEQTPTTVVEEFSYEDDGKWHMCGKEKPSLLQFINSHRKNIRELAEYKILLDFLQEDGMIQNHFSRKPTPNLLENSILFPLLRKYAKKAQSFDFIPSAFDKTYQEMEMYISSDKVEWVAFAPLYHFQCEVDEIDLEGNVKIRKILPEELEDVWNAESLHGQFSKFGFLEFPIFLIGMPYKSEKNLIDYYVTLDPLFYIIRGVLRLFKPGNVAFNRYYLRSVTSWGNGLLGATWGHPPTMLKAKRYLLLKKEIDTLKEFWKVCMRLLAAAGSDHHNAKYLTIALHRFNSAIEETDFEHKLLDQLIALESLYLESPDELKYRLSNRVAIMVSENDTEIQSKKDLVMTAYDVRSKIIHGKIIKHIKIKEKEISFENLVLEVENLLRKSILRFLAMRIKYEHKEILDKLDNALLISENRQKLNTEIKSIAPFL